MNGAELTYDLLASIMENFQSPEFYARYGPSSTQTTAMFYKSFNRMILLKISDLEQEDMPSEQISAFLNYCIHHQKIILSSRNTDLNFLRCFCYHLYLFLLFDDENIRNDAANVSQDQWTRMRILLILLTPSQMWKLLLLQKPDAVASIFKVRVKGIGKIPSYGMYILLDCWKHRIRTGWFGGRLPTDAGNGRKEKVVIFILTKPC